MAKETVAPVKKTTTVCLTTHVNGRSGLSRIERGNGFPSIVDKTEHAVEWLKAHGYKVTDIELVGEKPANWDTVFEIAPAAPSAPEEQPALIDPVADPADATAVFTEVVSNETAPAN